MNSDKLREAFIVWQQAKEMSSKARGSAVKRLAPLGFTVRDIALITGVGVFQTASIMGKAVPRPVWERWNPATLDFLYLFAVSYEDSGKLSKSALAAVTNAGTPLGSIARLTGIPLDKLREVVHD